MLILEDWEIINYGYSSIASLAGISIPLPLPSQNQNLIYIVHGEHFQRVTRWR
jgi:hypothetical protein